MNDENIFVNPFGLWIVGIEWGARLLLEDRETLDTVQYSIFRVYVSVTHILEKSSTAEVPLKNANPLHFFKSPK